MNKIAIYGGSFDPPHLGHKALALNLAKEIKADKVIIMPTFLSPFKEKSGATAEDRLNMCRLLFSESLFEVSDLEINRGGKSYTVDTLKALKEIYPNSKIYLFMGDDMFLCFNKWYKYKEILDICTLVTGCRTENLEELNNLNRYNEKELNMNAVICKSIPLEISSTEIRKSIKAGENKNLSSEVYLYIKNRGLYL